MVEVTEDDAEDGTNEKSAMATPDGRSRKKNNLIKHFQRRIPRSEYAP